MTTETTTLTAFLLEQIAIDEQMAACAWGDSWTALTLYPDRSLVVMTPRNAPAKMAETEGKDDDTAQHIAAHDPARVLATCAAHRAIVEMHVQDGDEPWCMEGCGMRAGAPEFPCDTLRALASIYADKSGFKDEWLA